MDPRDLDVLSRTVYGEARGEPDLGRLAVAYVPVNRALIAQAFVASHGRKHPLYGDGTVAGACTVPWQFSCFNPRDPNREKILALDLTSEEAAPCVSMATAALERSLTDPASGATHYCTAMAPSDGVDWPPDWTEGHEPTAVIGGQVFYRLG